jgi:thiol:disulfide interchange protein DsbD
MRLLAVLVLLLTGSGHLHAQSDELLEPEKAFALSASVATAEQLSFTWKIAEGYYMYRDKFRIKVESGEATIKELVMPDGKMKADEFFGDQEIYTGTKVIHALMDRNANAQEMDIVVEVSGQGCNEPVGVCYPPLKQSVSLQLAALDTGDDAALSVEQPLSQQSSGVDSLQSLRDLLGAGQAEQAFLDPEEAFRFDLFMRDPGNLGIRFDIADGYYLYREKIEFSSKTDGVGLAAYQLPPGIEKEDEYFGQTAVYYNGFDASLPLKNHALGGSEAIFKVTYQGCAEKGICYPPIEKDVMVDLLPFQAAHAATSAVAVVAEPPAVTGFWGYIIGAFGVGVLLTFTPCVLPMVPIMSSFIVGQSGGSGRARGGMLSAVYVLGTAVTYTAAGALAGATGDQLQAYFQNIWFIGFLSIVLVLLALSMFDIYELQMPSSVQSRLQQKTTGMTGGGLVMVFMLGVISALIVGACVSPLLIGALGVAIVEGDPVLGAAIMFAIAMGMGVFLVLIGFGMGKMVPRAGAWMNYVKYGFGIVLIGTAIYLLGTIHWVPVLYLWSALLIITAVYCGALQALPDGTTGWRYLMKGIGVFMLAWGVLALLGAMSGGRDILKPVNLNAIRGQAMEASSAQVHFAVVNNLDSLEEQLDSARLAGKPVMLDYYADWCVDCLRMEESTFKDPQVVKALGNFTLVQVDVTDAGDASTKAIKKRYGVYGPPAMLFFDTAGSERSDLRRYGYMSSNEFLAHIGNL